MKLQLIILIILVVLSGCDLEMIEPINIGNNTLTANFTSQTNCYQVNFTNTSPEGTTFSWDFGDGNVSSEENPSHIYQIPGDYTVMLTVSDATRLGETTMVISLEGESFNNKYGSSTIDEEGKDIIQMDNGNYLIMGSKATSATALVINECGEQIQISDIGTYGDLILRDMIKLSTGEFVFIGSDGENGLILKLSENQELIKTHIQSDASTIYEWNTGIETSDNRIVIGGTKTVTGQPSEDCLVKIDLNLNNPIIQSYPKFGTALITNLVEDSDGGFIFFVGELIEKIRYIKTNSNLGGPQVLDIDIPSIPFTIFLKSLTMANDNDLVLTGAAGWNSTVDPVLIKVSKSGEEVRFAKIYGPDQAPNLEGAYYEGQSVIETAGGGFVIAGGNPFFNLSLKAFIIKTYEDGNIDWGRGYEFADKDNAQSIVQTKDGGFMAAGLTSVNSGDHQIYVFKTDSEGF